MKSRPLILPIIVFLLGVFLSKYISVNTDFWIFFSAIILILSSTFLLRKKPAIIYGIIVVCFFLTGFLRSNYEVFGPLNQNAIYPDNKEKVTVIGTVISYPEYIGHRKIFLLKTSEITDTKSERKSNMTLIVKDTKLDIGTEVGDTLIINGKLFYPKKNTVPGGFDYSEYLKLEGIKATLYSNTSDITEVIDRRKSFKKAVFYLRRDAEKVFDKYLPNQMGAVIKSLILGIRSSLSSEVKEIFIKTGVMHILAVSGLHVWIIAGIFLYLAYLSRIPMRIRYILAILCIWIFCIFVGARPSVLRASIMGTIVILNILIGRKGDPLSSILLAAFLIVFFSPASLFKAGFILSFAAVISIVYLLPPVNEMLKIPTRKRHEGVWGGLKRRGLSLFALSLSVWIGVLPLIAYYFKIFTPSVILTNFLAIPLLLFLIFSSLILLVIAKIGLIGASLVTIILVPIINSIGFFMIDLLKKISDFPLSSIKIDHFGVFEAILYYFIVIALLWRAQIYLKKSVSSENFPK